MEKRLIKKDVLAGIAKKMAGDFLVWAPVKKEDNILFETLQKDAEPFFAYLNSKNAPKNVFFPHTEALLKYTRTEKGMVFSEDENKAKDSVLFGVRPCDAHSFALLDKLFDQEKYKDGRGQPQFKCNRDCAAHCRNRKNLPGKRCLVCG